LLEIFSDYVYLVNPNNINEIKTGMKNIISNKQNFVKIDLKKFDWQKTAKDFLEMLLNNRY